MFDIWIGDINLTVAVLAVSAAVLLPGQLLLCFKVKSRRLRFAPVVILFMAAMANIIMYLAASDWKRLTFAVGAVYIVFMMLMCGAGWIIWAVVKKRGEAP